MFDRVGEKIKALAQILCWLGIFSSVVVGLVMLTTGEPEEGVGILVILFGSLGAYISSLLLYGYGELIDNSDRAAGKSLPQAPEKEKIPSATEIKEEKARILYQWKEQGLITEEELAEKMKDL